MNEWAELDRALSDLAASGAVEVHEDGHWLAGLSSLHYELRRNGKILLVHLWSDERNLTRRILKVKEQSSDRIVFEVQRFGRASPGRLEFLRTDSPRAAGRVTRERFRERFHRFLAEHFPDSNVDSLTASPDLEHSFSGVYVRGRMHEGSHEHALIAVSPAENSAVVEGILSFGILWLDWARGHTDKRAVQGLRVFVPEGTSRFIRERSLGLSPSVRLEIFEYNQRESTIRQMDAADAGNLQSRLVTRGDAELALTGAGGAMARIRSLAPAGSALAGSIAARIIAGTNEVAFCYLGLEFARWSQEGITFGLYDPRERVTENTRARLVRLMLVWLVAPGLRFHPATDTPLKYLTPEIRITRIGVNENWRRGVKIVFRQ